MLISSTKSSTSILIPSASHFSIKLALKNRKRIDEMKDLCDMPAFTSIEFNKRNRNFSLQEIMRSRNQAFSKNSNRICKKRNSWNSQYALQKIRKNYQKGEKHSDVYRRIASLKKDSRNWNRNWNNSDIHAWTCQSQQSDKRFWQNNHNESETASY